MKFLVFIIGGAVVYLILNQILKKTRFKKFRKWLGPFVIITTLSLFLLGAYLSDKQPDIHCGNTHKTTSIPPAKTQSAKDYFDLGNYNYDVGNCKQALTNYTKAIQLDTEFAEAYNNRAYTNMRMRNYASAIPDLNKAIELRPDYVNALMNRGDIYNYYYNVDRNKAIEDYNKVIALVKDPQDRRNLSVCGHKLLAENGGWTPKIYLQVFSKGFYAGCQ